jgi:hypothetical protein
MSEYRNGERECQLPESQEKTDVSRQLCLKSEISPALFPVSYLLPPAPSLGVLSQIRSKGIFRKWDSAAISSCCCFFIFLSPPRSSSSSYSEKAARRSSERSYTGHAVHKGERLHKPTMKPILDVRPQ